MLNVYDFNYQIFSHMIEARKKALYKHGAFRAAKNPKGFY